ncbi:hypothetical protein L6164_007455 [Bauhinia variegata]|uniref:Uncharacterized protein n=1 Tax=Bauhinia variegata TaxID=167791 RepID=A0ACB9PCW3_BAUVA|nr:hypothetical protein L6164_007455 [Bauhinia variegata]
MAADNKRYMTIFFFGEQRKNSLKERILNQAINRKTNKTKKETKVVSSETKAVLISLYIHQRSHPLENRKLNPKLKKKPINQPYATDSAREEIFESNWHYSTAIDTIKLQI